MHNKKFSFYFCLSVFIAFVFFLYGPTFTIILLSFQGPEGGLTFPMNGISTHWFTKLFEGGGYVDIGAAFRRSLLLGTIVMVLTVVLSVAAGMAFRKRFLGSDTLFYLTISSLIVPSIILSLGIALEFRLLDETIKFIGGAFNIEWILNDFQTSLAMFSSAGLRFLCTTDFVKWLNGQPRSNYYPDCAQSHLQPYGRDGLPILPVWLFHNCPGIEGF